MVKTTLAAAAADIRIEIAVTTQALPAISTDRTRFTQIVTNFGSNAVKYNR